MRSRDVPAARPALGKVRVRLFALADDIERHNLFGGTRSTEAAADIRTMCDAIWDLVEGRCDDLHALQCAREEAENLSLANDALRHQRDELLSGAKMALALVRSGGIIPIDGMTKQTLEHAISLSERAR